MSAQQSPSTSANFKSAIILFVVLTAVTGLAYPAAVTALSSIIFYNQANGSLIYRQVGDKQIAVGSKLLGQNFSSAQYFWPRPSATSPSYNAAASSGSNLGPTNQDLLASIKQRVEAVRVSNPEINQSTKIPVDLVTASGSGLDPDISPAAAKLQIDRVAKARGLNSRVVEELVNTQRQPKQVSFFDEPHVNVLQLNLALDKLDKQESQ